MLTKEQKYLGARYTMLLILNTAIGQNDYSCLQKLYELIHIDNNKLIKRLHEHRFICYSPKDTIFTDMEYIIFLESENNHAIIETFYNIYAKKYPSLIKKLAFAEKKYEKDMSADESFIRGNHQHNKPIIYTLFSHFLLFYSDVIWDCEPYGLNFNQYCQMAASTFTSDYNLHDIIFRFDSDEEVFSSAQYKRFLSKRREELATVANSYFKDMNITANNLDKSLGEILRSKATPVTTPLRSTIDGIVTGVASDLLVANYGGAVWYDQVTTTTAQTNGFALNYRPDIDELIDLYYKNVVKNACVRYSAETGEKISRIYLARELSTDSPSVDLFSIMYMYNLSIYCKLFTTLLEDYYRNFSWEKLTQQALSIRYENIVSSLQEQIKSCTDKISLLAEQNHLLRQQIVKNTNTDVLPYERTISTLNEKLEAKDLEILSLKQQLESKERYIELLSSADDPEIEEEVNLDRLKEKRYLFVGHIKEALPQLHREFPNSLFMENESFSLHNIKVDGIIMLIKYMSHAQFYKINSTTSLSNIPIVRCNTKNINTIFSAMNIFI